MDALKIMLLYAHCEDTTVDKMLEQTPLEDVLKMKKIINQRIRKEERNAYIVTDNYGGSVMESNVLLDFVRKQRNTNKEWDHYSTDPIYVIATVLFSEYVDGLKVHKEKLLPTQYFVNCFDMNAGIIIETRKQKTIVTSNYKVDGDFVSIANRPTNLFADLSLLAQANGWNMNIEYALQCLPTEGDYRLYD